MRPQARIVIRPLDALADAPEADVPTQALTDYFRSCGADVTFESGQRLANDPTRTEELTDAFCAEQAPPTVGATHWPAVLVVGAMSTDGAGTNGILLDLKSRGACAVFTRSFAFRNGSADDRFEVFVHEIGHLLNLTHREADEPFPTAMAQWDERSSVQSRSALWIQAIGAANAGQQARLRSFFGDGSRRPMGLPMSATCCSSITTSILPDVEPWGSAFKDDSDGSLDSAAKSIVCDLAIQTEHCSVGQALDFSVDFRLAPGASGGDIPQVMDIRSGHVRLHVMAPDGSARIFQSGTRTCGDMRRRIRPGQIIRRNYSLLRDVNGLLFPKPGTYQVGISVPQLDVMSTPRQLDVAPATDDFANAAFQMFLRQGLPASSRRGWRLVDEALRSATWSPFQAHLATKGCARGIRPLGDHRHLSRAAPRILEKDALLRLFMLRREPSSSDAAVHRALDHAERVFRKCDTEHPTLEYLNDVRRHMFLQRKESRRSS